MAQRSPDGLLYRCKNGDSGSELVSEAALSSPVLFCGKTAAAELAPCAEVAGPMQESEQTSLFLPNKVEKFPSTDGVRLTAGIRLNAPA
jgi:hypothetical protein